MHITLGPDERDTCRKALGRIQRVTKAAMQAYEKAELETLTADAQLSAIDGALTALDSAGESEDVEFIQLHRSVVRAGIRLLVSDAGQTKDRELSLGIATDRSEDRIQQLERLARRLGEQQELELTSDMLDYPSSQVGAPAGIAD